MMTTMKNVTELPEMKLHETTQRFYK